MSTLVFIHSTLKTNSWKLSSNQLLNKVQDLNCIKNNLKLLSSYKHTEEMTNFESQCRKVNFTVGLEKLRELMVNGHVKFTDGYAPFCKHLFIKNFTDATCGTIDITKENEHLLRSGYIARTAKELAVLTRWFPKSLVEHELKKAEYLDVILYSREQVKMENEVMNEPSHSEGYKYDYYVVSIKPQDLDCECPILPITMMRNTLVHEGGSGVPINHEMYLKSVEYWSNKAIVMHD
ncbi:Protein of unknown function DUF3228 [Babesia duncani]|uniref:Uncharacterized protein n=1 Tax=Babesia duncani TaxID=323732 RepID=A0AAD9UNN1_9APIC|nr:Protein of unknown function DUF3228 [Babesia duncani]